MRLQRIGRKNSPSYRVVVVDSRQAVSSGNFVDMIGFYEPKSGTRRVDAEKAKAWLAKGVQASPTVHNMLISLGVIAGEKITVQAPKKEVPAEAPKEEVAQPAAAEEAPVETAEAAA